MYDFILWVLEFSVLPAEWGAPDKRGPCGLRGAEVLVPAWKVKGDSVSDSLDCEQGPGSQFEWGSSAELWLRPAVRAGTRVGHG